MSVKFLNRIIGIIVENLYGIRCAKETVLKNNLNKEVYRVKNEFINVPSANFNVNSFN